MTEQWKDIPSFEGAYQVSSEGRIRSLPRIVIRSNNVAYTCQGRVMRLKRHRVTGLVTVGLATGARGECRWVYVHRLVADVFGDQEAA
jgi:hypothetical protein